MSSDLECSSCGACCCNAADNIREGFLQYVAVDDPRSRLLTDRSLRRKLVTTGTDGAPHMRLLGDRCAALLGAVGREVRCSVYADRPAQCRRVQPGDRECLRARAERGMDGT